ncbi:uncharacterized protein LOC115058559 isoform X2 [Echeneis naucrates]|nr:uncharacterized protein LOC115058559 isoform X2 [Echeneis naucrates]
MRLSVLFTLLLTVLTEVLSSTDVSAGRVAASRCPPQWLLFQKRCFGLYPVWSSWSTARSLCSLTGGSLVSLHSPEETHFVQQLANTYGPAWLDGSQVSQNESWVWSDHSTFSIGGSTNQRREDSIEGGACMEMNPEYGGLHVAPCWELRFYICAVRASHMMARGNRKAEESDLVPGVSLFDLMWQHSERLPEEILRSSSVLNGLRSGNLTERCYISFIQQEALYLYRVSSTLEVLLRQLHTAEHIRSLLLDTLSHYSSRNQRLPPPILPSWLQLSLQSFHSVVLEEPVYWLVALSARARLHHFLAEELLPAGGKTTFQQASGSAVDYIYQDWAKDSLWSVSWTSRYKEVIDKHQNKMDAFKAIDTFRQHMMNQKSFYRAADCDTEGDG